MPQSEGIPGFISYDAETVQQVMQSVQTICEQYQQQFDSLVATNLMPIARALSALPDSRLGNFTEKVAEWQAAVDSRIKFISEMGQVAIGTTGEIAAADREGRQGFLIP